jgi:nicotinamide-nucleotide amidase
MREPVKLLPVNVELINTGSELMLGRVLNTHQQWLCRRLADLGYVVTRQTAVADTAQDIQQAVRESLSRATLVITTGGLGPTSDDITRELIAKMLGRELQEDAGVLRQIDEFFARRNRPRPAGTRVEAQVPAGAIVLPNHYGTAPGLALAIDPDPTATAAKPSGRQWLIMLPGPPRELRPMFDLAVTPLLHRELTPEFFACRTLRSTGIGESIVQEMVAPPLQSLVSTGLEIGYCARPGAVDVRLTASGERAANTVAQAQAIVEKVLGKNIFGYDDDEIEQVVIRRLTEKKQTLALAESCTGGAIAHRLTNVPGASVVFRGGIVSYSNDAKQSILGVKTDSLTTHGAVSEVVAAEMAAGVRAALGADYALAVTGIAGPGGGTESKPVGTVYIALASPAGVKVKKQLNAWDRETFKQVTAQQALELLRVTLLTI